MKKLHTFLLVLGVGFLAYLLWTIGIDELGRELRVLGWGLVPFIALEVAGEAIHALGWRHCLSGAHRRLSWFRIFRIRMAGYAINYLTPTATLGGEVTKGALLAAHQPGPQAVSGVLLGKVCFAMGHLLFVVVGSLIILWQISLPPALWIPMVLSSALVGAGILAFLLLQKYGKFGAMIRWLAARQRGGRIVQEAARQMTDVDETLKAFYREQPRDLAVAVGWHLLGNAVGILQSWVFFAALKQPASLAAAAGVFVLGVWFDLLTFAVPMNVGALEASRIVALKAIGSTSLLGMTYGIALRLAQLFCAGIGLVSHALLASEPASTHQLAPPGRKPGRLGPGKSTSGKTIQKLENQYDNELTTYR